MKKYFEFTEDTKLKSVKSLLSDEVLCSSCNKVAKLESSKFYIDKKEHFCRVCCNNKTALHYITFHFKGNIKEFTNVLNSLNIVL